MVIQQDARGYGVLRHDWDRFVSLVHTS